MKIEPLSPPGTVEIAHDLERISAADLGSYLPCGFPKDDGARTSFAFLPPTMGQRKRLQEVVGRKEIKRWPGRVTAYWLARALEHLDGKPMAEYGTQDAQALAVARLSAGDVLHLMFAWQRLAHPKGFPVSIDACPRCGEAWGRVLVDLSTLDVHVRPVAATRADPLVARLALPDGLPGPGGRVSTVLLRCPTWLDTFWTLTETQWSNSETIRCTMFKGAIIGTDAAVPMLTDAMLDELMPEDCNALDEALDRISPTPDLQIDVSCPRCEESTSVGLNWRQADFLGPSSQTR
jgi:hypothetical protein